MSIEKLKLRPASKPGRPVTFRLLDGPGVRIILEERILILPSGNTITAAGMVCKGDQCYPPVVIPDRGEGRTWNRLLNLYWKSGGAGGKLAGIMFGREGGIVDI
jgi:hypothetical protein